jgi:uncharacterized lipoprotein YddW (UPF0748 family)
MFQVRPECDALYQSSLEPWSYWLTGAQGLAPNPLWDPLKFAIDEAHKRGMELHAWFNPYRAVKSVGAYTIASNHVSKTHPDWILNYTTEYLLDPGNPSVRAHVTNVILDVVRRYDVDGIHWDDYFYSYKGTSNQDSVSWGLYNGGYTNKGDWRRNNVNTLVRMVYDSIQVIEPWVKFGISPFGIWKNSVSEGGAGTSGMEGYYSIYCDAMNWLIAKKIDYVNPQVYWSFGYSAAKYELLAPWWQNNSQGRHIYIGQAAYRITDSNWGESELPNQIRLNRSLNIPGSVFFRANYGVANNPKGFRDSLINNFYKCPVLIPTMPWKDNVPPLAPPSISVTGKLDSVVVKWSLPAKASDGDTAKYFVVYRTTADTVNINDPRLIRLVTLKPETTFVDAGLLANVKYRYLVTSVDKLHNESATTATATFIITGVDELAGIPATYRLEQNYPNPFNPTTTIQFTLAQSGQTSLKIYDVLGREVRTIVDGVESAGMHTVSFAGSDLSSGVYFYRITSGSFVETKKMILQK